MARSRSSSFNLTTWSPCWVHKRLKQMNLRSRMSRRWKRLLILPSSYKRIPMSSRSKLINQRCKSRLHILLTSLVSSRLRLLLQRRRSKSLRKRFHTWLSFSSQLHQDQLQLKNLQKRDLTTTRSNSSSPTWSLSWTKNIKTSPKPRMTSPKSSWTSKRTRKDYSISKETSHLPKSKPERKQSSWTASKRRSKWTIMPGDDK